MSNERIIFFFLKIVPLGIEIVIKVNNLKGTIFLPEPLRRKECVYKETEEQDSANAQLVSS